MDSPKWRLILIDDGSEKETRDYLTGLASRPQVTLHRNEVVVGYTKAANRGIAMSSGELVILLNSDTIVVPGWAEKLADALFSTPGAGIVGPLSNAASHQSIPEHRDANGQSAINDLPHGVTVEEMDRHCERWTEDGPLPRVPLVHGFCFGIARPVIEAIGGFDQESFPFGYAEENDYCFRATDAGFGLVLATHTFVFHAKTKSYSAERRALLAKAGGEAFRRKHGKDRVERATRTMQDNPILMHFRECARAVEKGAFASLNRGSTHQKEPTPTGAARSSMRHGADFRSPMLRAPSGTPRAS
jgi:GT2 family glycosyltransferase